jgi:uncharacterized protein YqgV (UPF0045/DUF77 family)
MNFLDEIVKNSKFHIETNAMSTLISGEYDEVMNAITIKLKKFMMDHTTVTILKISNGCEFNPES